MTISLSDFTEQNSMLFEDLARETGRLISEIAGEHYITYLTSIRDRDYD